MKKTIILNGDWNMIDQKYLDLLTELNTDENPHTGGALLDHLCGTYRYLKEWGNHEAVCAAGLFHSIYGTQSYKTQSATFEQREMIRQVIGEDAELRAYFFCVTKRGTFFEEMDKSAPILYDQIRDEDVCVAPEILRDLIEMEIANYIEFLPRIEMTVEEMKRFEAKVDSAKDLITGKGYEAIKQAIKNKNEVIAQSE